MESRESVLQSNLAGFGEEHLKVAIRRQNLAQAYQKILNIPDISPLMHPIKRLFIFTEADIPRDPTKSKGATTRLVARIAEYIKKQENLNVIYCCIHSDKEIVYPRANVITDPQKLVQDYKIGATDLGIFIRYNFEETLPVLTDFKKAQGTCIAHLADPHVENKATNMQSRVQLHKNILTSVDGVIATSDELKKIGEKYNQNVAHIPDVIDFPRRLPPKVNFLGYRQQDLPITLLSSGYALHHQSFKKALLEVQLFCEHQHIRMDYHIATSEPKATEVATHGNYFKELEKLVAQLDTQSKLRVYLHAPFRTEILEWLLEIADISVIPGFSNEFLSPFQQHWFPKKGSIRVTQGIAAGLPVIVTKQYPESYQLFLDNKGAIIGSESVSQGLYQLLSYDKASLETKIAKSQTNLFHTHDLPVIAKCYLEFMHKTLMSKLV